MVTVTSERHKVTATIPMNIDKKIADMFAVQIDDAVTKLIEKCTDDKHLVSAVEFAKHRDEAVRLVSKHLKSATGHAPWLRAWVGPVICASALDAIKPAQLVADAPGCY